VADHEVAGDGDSRRHGDRLLIDDARESDAPRHAGALGENEPAEQIENAARHIAG
jgi:hypothetical protein